MADTITPLVARVRRRLRTQRSLELGGRGALWALGLGAPLLLAFRLSGHPAALISLVGLLALPVVGVLWGALHAVAPQAAAQRIDQAHRTHDLIASACGFAALDGAEQTPFMRACIAEARRVAPSLDPRRAVGLHAPAEWPWLLGLTLLLALVGRVRLPESTPPPITPPPRPAALVAADDLDAFADELRALDAEDDQAELLRQTARELDALIEQLAARELDRIEALEKLQRLEAGLRDGLGGDAEQLREALAELARALGKAPVTDSLAEALQKAQPAAAQQELQRLAQRVRNGELERPEAKSLREGLERASKAPDDRSREKVEQARKELDRLLKKQAEAEQAGTPPEPRSLLDKKKRELDRLERDAARAEQRKRELDRLRRELDQAARELGQQRSQEGAGAMDQAAQELQRMAGQQRSQDKAGQLSRTLSQLREMIERGTRESEMQGQQAQQGTKSQAPGGAQPKPGQGQGDAPGQDQPLDLQRFSQDARGAKPSDGEGGAPKPGGTPGQPGAGGKGQSPAQALVPSGDEPAEVLLRMEQEEAQAQGGQAAGQGGTPGQDGDTKRLAAGHADTQLTGAQGRGPTRSEVIREASAHGFASRDYEQVLADYKQHAESVLERDQIPGGYRYYVRRYFQLIRPREEPQ